VSTEVGQRAEAKAAKYLRRRWYKILERNWRTRWCEIDLVAERRHVIYFVEVKYRGSDAQGGGLDYITQRKLAQMHFAAEFWMASHSADADYRLAAIELSGPKFQVTEWLDEL
jgi:uncharacterized protein (TIGR00252 family)